MSRYDVELLTTQVKTESPSASLSSEPSSSASTNSSVQNVKEEKLPADDESMDTGSDSITGQSQVGTSSKNGATEMQASTPKKDSLRGKSMTEADILESAIHLKYDDELNEPCLEEVSRLSDGMIFLLTKCVDDQDADHSCMEQDTFSNRGKVNSAALTAVPTSPQVLFTQDNSLTMI